MTNADKWAVGVGKNTKEPVGNAGKSKSTWHSVNCGDKHFVTRPNICIEAHVMPEHLCPIGITSMTPTQMVTGCEHLISPVPINLPVNSSFDTPCPLFCPRRRTWSLPFSKTTHAKARREERFLTWSYRTSHGTFCTSCEEFWPISGMPRVTSSSCSYHSFEILMSDCPLRVAPAQQLNQIYNYCHRRGWQIN